jgi:DNA-binding CsgD family transcriptional regulator
MTSVHDLLDLLYQAATSVDGWGSFLAALAGFTGSDVAALMAYDPHNKAGDVFAIHGAEDVVEAQYAAWTENFVSTIADQMRTGAIVTNKLGLCVLRESDAFAYVTMLRAPDRPDYGHREWELLELLRPHLQRALAVHGRMGTLEDARSAAQGVIDRLPVALFFVDSSGKVVSRNAEAERLLQSADSLVLDRDGRLQSTGPDGWRLTREIAAVCLMGAGVTNGGAAFPLPRRKGCPVGVLVSPLGGNGGSKSPVAVVRISDPGPHANGDAAQSLRAIYDLTDVEARLACVVASGHTPKEAAKMLRVSLNTVRCTLKRVFAKTGTRRQAELVRLVLNGLATFLQVLWFIPDSLAGLDFLAGF